MALSIYARPWHRRVIQLYGTPDLADGTLPSAAFREELKGYLAIAVYLVGNVADNKLCQVWAAGAAALANRVIPGGRYHLLGIGKTKLTHVVVVRLHVGGRVELWDPSLFRMSSSWTWVESSCCRHKSPAPSPRLLDQAMAEDRDLVERLLEELPHQYDRLDQRLAAIRRRGEERAA